jgi:hypothetical protein
MRGRRVGPGRHMKVKKSNVRSWTNNAFFVIYLLHMFYILRGAEHLEQISEYTGAMRPAMKLHEKISRVPRAPNNTLPCRRRRVPGCVSLWRPHRA